MKICILNSSNPTNTSLESDSYTDLRDKTSCFKDGKCIKQCRSWHGWPYALESEFFVYNKNGWQGCFKYDGIIILVNRDIKNVIPLVKKLKMMKKKVAISFHESVSDLITSSGVPNENIFQKWIELKELVDESDFYLNIFGQMQPFFEGWFGLNKVKFCNHTAPLDWNDVPKLHWDDKKYDVLIGTRTFNQRIPRNTFPLMGALNGWAQKTEKNVHYLTEDGDIKDFLQKLGLNNIIIHKGPLEWNDWIQFLSQFKVLCHFDTSLNLGQLALDCAMVRTVPIGGTCWNMHQIGTDDHGDLNYTLEMINNVFEHPHSRIYSMKEFREKIHPDKIKEDLMRIFNE